jgi:hypothetical protein
MNVPRVALALVGLIFLFLAYIERNVVFLVIALVAFGAGLVLMGAFTRQRKSKEDRFENKTGAKANARKRTTKNTRNDEEEQA